MASTDNQLNLQELDEPVEGSSGSWPFRLQFTSSSTKLGVLATLVIGSIATGVWLLPGEEGPPPTEQLTDALDLLDERETIIAWQTARDIALELEETDFRDPDFAGAVEFILGVTAFREAETRDEWDELGRRPLYNLAVRYLNQALERAVIRSRQPELMYVRGMSLYRLGKGTVAREELETAVEKFPDGRIHASIALTHIYLGLNTPSTLDNALQLNSQLLALEGLKSQRKQLVEVYMQRAQIFLALERYNDVDQALKRLENFSEKDYNSMAMMVFRARILMKKGSQDDYDKAFTILEPVAKHVGLDARYPREASYLMGVCQEQLDKYPAAIHSYGVTASKYKESHEGLAANLRRAELLRAEDKHEQARDAYRQALRMVNRPKDYANRWVSIDEFRTIIANAYDGWIEKHGFNWAIDLAKDMAPLFPEVEANEKAASAHHKWALHLEEQYKSAPYSKRLALEQEFRNRWRSSGKAYADLAVTLRTSSEYPGKLWTSAEHYYEGQDFESALVQLTRFINTGPKTMMARALVQYGKVLLDLDRLDEALEQFTRVIDSYPTSDSVFDAQWLLGKCHLERDEPDLAETAWRGILTSSLLTPGTSDKPGSQQWRQALFSLGRLLYFRAATRNDVDRSQNEPASNNPLQAPVEDFNPWDEPIRRLGEFLERYPDVPESAEARYLLAKSFQRSAKLPRGKLKTAETENARLELRRTMDRLLNQGRLEFQQLQRQLLTRDESDRLDKLGKRVLQDCYFEIAHTYYSLREYDNAINAYVSAANQFSGDPRVLLAYVQMSNCYDRLDKPQEARSMLEQAKVIISQLPDDIFQKDSTNLTRQEWDVWLDWARNLRQSSQQKPTTAP